MPLNLKGFNNIQNKKTHVNKTIKERFTEWIILGEKKLYCGTPCCKISSSCLDKVSQVLSHLSESLRRKLFNNTSDKLELIVFCKRKNTILVDLQALELKFVFVDLVAILGKPVIKFSSRKTQNTALYTVVIAIQLFFLQKQSEVQV